MEAGLKPHTYMEREAERREGNEQKKPTGLKTRHYLPEMRGLLSKILAVVEAAK